MNEPNREPRPPRESLAAVLAVREHGNDDFTATLESFWGSSAKGDLLARAALVATAGTGRAIASAHTFFTGRARPDVGDPAHARGSIVRPHAGVLP